MDFLLKKANWGIECVREGDRLEEHICRFLKGDRYYEWIQKQYLTDYIVIDFRKTKPLFPTRYRFLIFSHWRNLSRATKANSCKDVPFLIYVVYTEDFSAYEVFDAGLKPVHDRLSLLS